MNHEPKATVLRALLVLCMSACAWTDPAPAMPHDDSTLVVCDDVVEPSTLNPVHEFTARNHTVVQQIFDGLLVFDEEGLLRPCLARSWRRLSPTTCSFDLRPEVHFHDGSRLRSSDVAFSIERYLDPSSGFPARDYFSTIRSVRIIDEEHFLIETHCPDGLLEHKLAFLRILPKGEYTRLGPKAFDRLPTGTGPFRFEKWVPGEAIHFIRNERYWSSPLTRLKRLVFRFIPMEEQVEALLHGEVDVLTDLAGTNTLRVKQAPGLNLQKKYCYFTYPGSLCTTRFPFRDRRARLGLQLAMNRKHLIRYEARGNGRILATTSMPGQRGYNPDLIPYPYDPSQARRLFSEVFGTRPKQIRALIKSQAHRIGSFVKASLAEVGVDMHIESTNDSNQFERLAEGNWDLFLGSCPDPFCHVSFIQSIGTFSKGPFSLVRDPVYDQMFIKALMTLPGVEHDRAFQRLDAYVHEQCLNVFTYQKLKIYAFRKGLTFAPYVSGMPYFQKAGWHAQNTAGEER